MAELNEQDPITGRKLPRLANYNGQEPVNPNRAPLPRIARNSYVPEVQLVDYTKSGYDNPGGTFVEDLPRLNSIRAENQGFGATLFNGLGRALTNVIPTVVGNVASILDFEDYVNQDNEVGNAITRAMEEFKTSVNEDYLPIFRENPGESFNLGDSAWWIENGSSLAESIGAFAITGAGIGSAFNAVGKGLSTINGLSKLGQAGKAAATLLSATGLNQAESITTAMQVYDTTYKTAIANGQDDATAKQNAADAASYSISINRANIALNLTSAGAFIRSPNLTRQVRHAFTGQGAKEVFQEGSQEYLEETLNYVAQKEGERSGDAAAKGQKYKYDFARNVDDALSLEGIESGVLGFIGGAGQTGLTRTLNRMNGRAAQQDAAYQSQQESIARIQGLQNAGIVPNVTNVFNSMQRNTELQNQINSEIEAGNDAKAKELQYQLLNTQISDSLENGTVDQLESVYDNMQNLSVEEAEAKGLDIDVNSPYNYKKKAAEAIQIIKDVEDGYLNIANKGYVNPDEVLDTYIQGKTLNRLLVEQKKDFNDSHTQALQDKLNLDIQADLNSTNPPAELTNLPSYKRYLIDRTLLEDTQKKVIDNNAQYENLTSTEYQDQLKADRQAKLEEGLRNAEKKIKDEEEKAVKKRQKEVKKRVDEANKSQNDIASESNSPIDIPLPDVTDIPIQEEVIDNISESDIDVTDVDNIQNIPIPTEEFLEPEITDENYPITPEERTTANIVEQEEVNDQEKEIKQDGLVRSIQDIVATNNKIKFDNITRQRDVANTIISLNVDYIETVLGNVDTQTNQQRIFDTYDDDGNLIVNENFDSRLQSPNQFKVNDEVRIIIPTYQEILERGNDNYSESDFNEADNNIDKFAIAFVDSNNNIIGYLPTRDNVNKRVSAVNKEVELAKNRKLRETIFNNRDKQFTVKITRKSPGSLLTNNTTKSLYNALGDGTKLANDVSLAIYKDSRLQTSLDSNFNNSLVNKAELQLGYIYSIVPTAESGNYLAAPMNISRIGESNARSILKMIQLYKANPAINADKALVAERNELAREIDLSNNTQFDEAVSSIIFKSTTDDAYMFKMGTKKLSLGLTPDMSFTWEQVMTDTNAQVRIVDILSNRYHAVQLSKFGQRFNQYTVGEDNKLQQIRHNNYFDYLNSNNVVNTNVQGFPVTGENNQYYFTGQSVIEFSDPIIVNNTSNQQFEEASIVEPNVIEAPQVIEEVERAVPEKPKNKLGIKYKPKNRPQIEEDFNFISNIDNIKDIDKQAEELIKKCQG